MLKLSTEPKKFNRGWKWNENESSSQLGQNISGISILWKEISLNKIEAWGFFAPSEQSYSLQK